MLDTTNAMAANAKYCQFSATAYLTSLVTEHLCSPEGAMGNLEKYSKKVAGGFCYAGLMMLAVIEHIARLVICALAALPVYFLKDEWVKHVEAYAVAAVQHLIDDPLRLVKGFVKNCTGQQFTYEELALCRVVQLDTEPYVTNGFVAL